MGGERDRGERERGERGERERGRDVWEVRETGEGSRRYD